VLRQGLKVTGCKFRLAFWKPETTFNPDTEVLYQANQFSVMRQVRYSEKSEHSLDLVLFLNGLPLFTAALKHPLNGQDVQDAIRQYKTDRDPREPLFAYGRCLAHFVVDPDLVYVTTQLAGAKTRFLPFNQGKFRGAGNPPIPPTRKGYSTGYLWDETWARDSVLDLVRQFVHEVEEEDEKGRKTGGTIYTVLSDGEVQEGSTWEAVMMASSLRLDNLVAAIDNNDFQSLGRTSETHPSFYPLLDKFHAFGWEAVEVDGHDSRAIFEAVSGRQGGRPFMLVAKTTKGKGVSYMENVPIWHYRSPNKDEYRRAVEELGTAP